MRTPPGLGPVATLTCLAIPSAPYFGRHFGELRFGRIRGSPREYSSRCTGRRDQHLVAGPHAHVARAADGQAIGEQAVEIADEPLAKPVMIGAIHYPGW